MTKKPDVKNGLSRSHKVNYFRNNLPLSIDIRHEMESEHIINLDLPDAETYLGISKNNEKKT